MRDASRARTLLEAWDKCMVASGMINRELENFWDASALPNRTMADEMKARGQRYHDIGDLNRAMKTACLAIERELQEMGYGVPLRRLRPGEVLDVILGEPQP